MIQNMKGRYLAHMLGTRSLKRRFEIAAVLFRCSIRIADYQRSLYWVGRSGAFSLIEEECGAHKSLTPGSNQSPL